MMIPQVVEDKRAFQETKVAKAQTLLSQLVTEWIFLMMMDSGEGGGNFLGKVKR